ncbi:protein CHROMATIN REMODELING 4-like [Bidens hawaiensis]|uniref:protein CHROMATIN REMODELING 4-like n=1 Tax=Bidens hawaiensis TaxID=980011 RepID=UPI004049EFB4
MPGLPLEDMETLDRIRWEVLVIDECQRPMFSTHLEKVQMLMADMKLLTVSCELVDICQSYKHILSIVDPKYEKTHTDADMEMNYDINTLKEILSPFIAFECTLRTPDLDEYWVPVRLSCMQIEQYCSILASNSDTLSTSLRSSPLHDILTEIQKCCDHPFLADPTLRNSSKEASLVGPLDAEINVSGKLRVLDKLLLEIKLCGLRALVLFHSAVNSEKISTGHILDDVVHQRFGENSYVCIPGRILTNASPVKRKELLEMFNSADSERFVCLCDYRACYSSIRLSRLDVVILFNSDRNPSNDIKALKRITIDPHRERLNILRLYSPFTVEEKALILSKQRIPVDSYVSWRVCHQLLGWGVSYLFSELQSCTDTRPQSSIDNLLHEMSFLLRNTGAKPAKCSMMSRVVTPVESMLLFGETETRAIESLSIDEYLIHNTQSVFWNKVVKESQPGPETSCNRLSRRVQKRARNCNEGENASTTPSFVRSKPRSKRKLLKNVGRKWAGAHTPFGTHQACETATPSTALNPGTNEGQQSQSEQPPPHTLETEIERIQREREKIAKSHEEKESLLLAECEKEISEIRKKYDGLIHDSKTCLTNEDIVLEEYEKLVNVNKVLAEFLSQHWQDTPILKKPQKETSAVKILQIPTYAPVRPMNPCLTGGPTTAYLPGSGLRFAAPHLRSNPSLSAPLHNRLNYYEPSLEPLPTLSAAQTVDKHSPV